MIGVHILQFVDDCTLVEALPFVEYGINSSISDYMGVAPFKLVLEALIAATVDCFDGMHYF